MNTTKAARDGYLIPFRSLIPFLLIAFGLAWGILGLFIFFPEPMAGLVGRLTGNHPLFYLCVYAPAIAAVTLVTYHGGIRGLKRFLSRFLLWRCPVAWYVFILVGVPLVFIAGSALKGNLLAEPFPFTSIQSLCVAMVLALIKGPVEEFGWRGLLLPVLQRRLSPLWAGLVLGVIWGFWHLPAFLLSGTQQSQWSFAPFFLGCIALSVIATALFNASRGSILLSALFHFMLMNPAFPDAAPYDTYLLVAIAVAVVWLNRGAMLTREGAIVAVVPG